MDHRQSSCVRSHSNERRVGGWLLFSACLLRNRILVGGILVSGLLVSGLMLSGPLLGVADAEDVPDEPKLEGAALKAHKKAVKAQFKVLKNEKNMQVVIGRIEAIGAEGTRAGRDALIKYATKNKNQQQLRAIFLAVATIGGKTSLEFLAGKQALRSKSFMAQQSAADALAKAKDPIATSALLEVMTNKRTKIEVVGACAKAVAQSAPDDEMVIETLFKQSRVKSDTIRSYTLEAIGYLKSDEAIARLEEALFKDKNTRARGAAATGMMNSGRADTIPLLKKALASDNSMSVKDACMTAIRSLSGGG